MVTGANLVLAQQDSFIMTLQKPVPANAHRRHYRPWSVRTVVIKLSRKLTATYRIRCERSLSRLLATLLAATSTWSIAELPTGLNVVAGQATASTPTANNMHINQATDKAVLNWQTFNIGVGKSVQFVQPTTTSVALNRIVGNEASSIYGSLSANGQVFLVNPSGVMFAPGAQVNVGGLVASSLGISNDDFMAGRYTFSGLGGGAVENHGTINVARGGYVLLAAPKVTNMGSITADAGSVGLLAGSRVTLDTSDMGLVRFSVDAAAANAAINSSGSIAVKGGQVAVLASAMGDAMATVINQSGVIRADSAVERNGMIVLSGGPTGVVKIAGTLSAAGIESGQTGGTVHVLGDKVLLDSGTRIDASGRAGGGTVLVGGNYQGKGSEQNASLTVVAPNASIDASAISTGNGGKVVVWADGATGFYGDIKATGGALSGNGGFAEVSGKQTLAFDGKANLSAAAGSAGTLLLDPLNIIISNAGPAAYVDVSTFAAQPGSNQTVSTATLNAVGGNITLQATNNITLSSAFTVAAGKSVNFEANNVIALNAALATSGTGGVTLSAATVSSNTAGTIVTTGSINTNAGNVQITATGLVNLAGAITANGGAASAGLAGRSGGSVNITGGGGVTTAAITASGGNGGTGNTVGGNAGSITIANSTAGNIVTGLLTASSGNSIGTALTGGTAGAISVTNSVAGGNVTTAALSTAGGAGGNGGAISLTSGSALSLASISTLNGSGGSTRGNLTVAASGAITQSAGIFAGQLNATLTGSASQLNLGTFVNSIAQLNAITAPGGFTLTNGNNAVAINGVISSTNNSVAITSGGGATTFNASGSIASGGGNVTLTNTNIAKVLGNIDTTGGASTGNFTIAGAGVISQAATTALKIKGTTTLAAGAGNNVTLANTGNDFTGAVSVATGNNVSITDANALVLGASTVSGTLAVNTTGAITQSGALAVTGVTTLAAGSASDITLNTAANNFSTVAITSGNNVVLRDANALVLGASTTAASLSVVAGADITQSGIVITPTFNAKTLSAGVANITLTNSANNVTTVNLQARNAGDTANGSGAIQYADATGFDVAAISTTGNATLSASGVVTQSGAVTATGLALTGAGGAYTLNNASNAITTLAANTGSVDFKQTGALIVGTVGTAGVTTTGVARIETTGAASNLTLNNAVTSSASGDAVILKAGSANAAGVSTGGQFINNVGATGIMAASGRYLVYSGAPDTTTEGMTGYSKRYNSDLNAVPATANSTFLYRIAPTLTVTANNNTRVYGDSNPALTGVVNSGLIDGDTAASVGVGYATTAVARTAVAAGPVAITVNVTNNENYTLATTNAALTITRRDLTVSATGQDRVFNGGTSANVVLTDNSLPGDLLTLSGVASFTDAGLGSGKSINVTGISVGGVDAANYNLINTSALTTGSILRPAAATFTGQLASAMTASFFEAADRRCEATSSAAPASKRAGVLIRRQSGSTDLNCN